MRAKVNPELRAGIDGVAPGQEGDFVDNHATRALVEAGVLLPLEELPAEPPARVKAAPVVGGPDLAALASLAAKLEAENAELRDALNNASASYEAQLTELRVALEAARAKPKKGAAAPDAPPAEG